jgi:hypothetical protein
MGKEAKKKVIIAELLASVNLQNTELIENFGLKYMVTEITEDQMISEVTEDSMVTEKGVE